MNLLAMFITLVITGLCIVGVRESVRANSILVAIKVVLLLGVIAVGAFYVHPENFHPFMPNGWHGVQAGAAIIFFAFIGFDAVTPRGGMPPSREGPSARHPGSLAICTVIYVGVCLVISGMLRYTEYQNVADPIAHASPRWASTRWLASSAWARWWRWRARCWCTRLPAAHLHGDEPRSAAAALVRCVHPKTKTPVNSTLLTGVIVLLPAGFMNIDEIVELTNIGTLFAFVLVCLGVMVLRVRRPDAERRFPRPRHLGDCAPGHRLLRMARHGPAAAHLGAILDLACGGSDFLFRLRLPHARTASQQ